MASLLTELEGTGKKDSYHLVDSAGLDGLMVCFRSRPCLRMCCKLLLHGLREKSRRDKG